MKQILKLSAVMMTIFSLSFPITAQAISYNIYVDASNETGVEDGTEVNPYDTISEAMTAAGTKALTERNIYVADGLYEENITLPESAALYGQSEAGVIIKNTSGTSVTMQNNTILSNVSVIGGSGIVVKYNATISSCLISQFGSIGINAEAGDYSITISNSSIFDGRGKGIYIQRSRDVNISDNNVYNNKGEGIDLRDGLSGSIKNNKVYDNSEGGIEVIVGGADLSISGNKLTSNGASGLALQYYKDFKSSGKIKAKKNTIKSNKHYGISCGAPSGGKTSKSYWKKAVKLSSNSISKNKKKYESRCKF